MSQNKRRKCWMDERMLAAITAVREKQMGYLKAAKEFQVPRTTLFRLCQKEGRPDDVLKTKLGRKPALTPQLEDELETHLLEMDKNYFGLTRMDVKRLAYQLAVSNGIEHTFSDHLQRAGQKWLKGFLRRHPRLSVRKPTGTSLARALGFTKENVDRFFDLLEAKMNEHNYPPDRVFNTDETGLSIVQSRCSEVISLKGKRQVGALTSAERGALVTAVLCMSAGGIFVPPLMIFPRKNMSRLLEKGAPPGTVFACHISGWIQTAIFTDWFKHFLSKVKPSKEDPVLLILDGHNSHTRNVDFLRLAKANHVTVLSLPPHTSHKMQPLDKSVMGLLKTFYSEEIRIFMRQYQRAVTQFDVAEVFGRAYLKVQSGAYAKKGFEATGLYPVNRHIFDQSEFLSAELEHEVNAENIPPDANMDQPNYVSPKAIMPVPALKKKTGSRGRKPGKANVITSSPYLKELENSIVTNEEKKLKVTRNLAKEDDVKKRNIEKRNINEAGPSGLAVTKRQQRKRLPSSSSDSSNDDVELQDSSDDDRSNDSPTKSPDDHDVACMFCYRNYAEDTSGETWIQCILCSNWAHEDCSGALSDHFVCDFCQ